MSPTATATRRHAAVSTNFDFAVTASDAGAANHVVPFLFAAAAAGCRPSQLVHIGDDPTADLIGALEAGCRAILVTRPPETEGNADSDSSTAEAQAQVKAWASRWSQPRRYRRQSGAVARGCKPRRGRRSHRGVAARGGHVKVTGSRILRECTLAAAVGIMYFPCRTIGIPKECCRNIVARSPFHVIQLFRVRSTITIHKPQAHHSIDEYEHRRHVSSWLSGLWTARSPHTTPRAG